MNSTVVTPPKSKYAPLVGGADSTKKGYSNADTVWNVFANCNGADTPPISSMGEDFFATQEGRDSFKVWFGSFCTFLTQHLWDGNNHYAPGTQAQCASGVINSFRKKHPKITMFQVGDMKTGRGHHPDSQWYYDLLCSLKVRSFSKCTINCCVHIILATEVSLFGSLAHCRCKPGLLPSSVVNQFRTRRSQSPS